MYEQGGENCPLKCSRTNMSKLHKSFEAFFQKPNRNFIKIGVWYVLWTPNRFDIFYSIFSIGFPLECFW